VKEFWVYTGLRIVLFLAALLVVGGIWMLAADTVPVLWVVVIAFIVSGLGSYVLLQRQRAAFAQRVETRAGRMTERFEERRSREDVD
jgi:hypothetical protein